VAAGTGLTSLGVFEPGHIGAVMKDLVVDLYACAELGIVGREWQANTLNDLMDSARSLALPEPLPEQVIVPLSSCRMRLPFAIGDYTDFYASIHHATNVGKLFRPDNPLLPNYRHMPIAYHGRASSIVVSGTPVRRPHGQLGEGIRGPTEKLDYELELGMFIGRGNVLGTPIAQDRAEEHLFGYCLVNDWSARDIQRWESQPLGPFLSKSFATSISPWVVMRDALEGCDGITLEVYLNGERMGRSTTRDLYWTPAQMIAHHTSNGCNLRPGDLLASGTVSGPGPDMRGCLLELRPAGPFLQDGDEVTLRGYAERPGFGRIDFGECRGVVVS
jgi:fumarylacetoacetase